jgi:hypothetical protein
VSLLLACSTAGCSNPDAQSSGQESPSSSGPKNAGEPPAPPPPASSNLASAYVQPTPERALAAFAGLYINWNYRTLSSTEQRLAAMSIGAARLAEQQAAASSASDSTIQQGHIYNSGEIVSVAEDVSQAGTWVIVTREQTGGDSNYEGLPATYHVTLARIGHVSGGYAVDEWLAQT